MLNDEQLVTNLFFSDLYAWYSQKLVMSLDNRLVGHCFLSANPGHTQDLSSRATCHESGR